MKKNKITHGDIANYIGKSIDTINGWKKRQPKLLELVKLGMECKKHNLDVEKIQKIVEIQETIKNS
jgi:hypothetical protein